MADEQPPRPPDEQLAIKGVGAMLARLREAKGYSQKDLAYKLAQVSGMPTITRHEVSRWEREERIPSEFWLEWLAQVLDHPLPELMEARARTKGYVAAARLAPTTAAVSLKFEHRTTTVRLHATFEKPELASSAVGVFGHLLSLSPEQQPSRSTPAPVAARPAPPATAALTAQPVPGVPMGIRHISGPGVPPTKGTRQGASRSARRSGT